MDDALKLLQSALPYTLILLAFAVFWRLGNMSITLSYASKTSEPERDQRSAKLKMERDEARREAERLRTPQ
jgi:hypothetical protein